MMLFAWHYIMDRYWEKKEEMYSAKQREDFCFEQIVGQ